MSKVDIDYSNTIIYKISCKNISITDVYVGHTTNFVQRKKAHKQSCNNDKYPNHSCNLYKVIRENGGWDNWNMEIVNFFNCSDNYEARQKEHEYFTLLNATLNSIEPMPKPKEKIVFDNQPKINPICETCNKIFDNERLYANHVNTNKHKENIENTQTPFVLLDKNKYICKICDIKTNNKKDFNKHILTIKHKNNLNLKCYEQNIQKGSISSKYVCNIYNKQYKSRVGLWSQKKACKQSPPLKDDQVYINSIDTNLIMQLLKQNDDFKILMIDQNNKMMMTFKETIEEVCKTIKDY
jgi:hypothetical protein